MRINIEQHLLHRANDHDCEKRERYIRLSSVAHQLVNWLLISIIIVYILAEKH